MPNAPRILALDVASRMGVTWARVGETPRSQTVKLTREGEGGSMDGVFEAAGRAIQWIADFTRIEEIDRIAIEAPIPEAALGHATNAWATALKFGILGGIGGAIKLREIEVRCCNIQAVRKFFLGKGNVKGSIAKPEVMRVCRALGWTPANHDEADAMAVWLFECNRVAPQLAHRVDPISLNITPPDLRARRCA